MKQFEFTQLIPFTTTITANSAEEAKEKLEKMQENGDPLEDFEYGEWEWDNFKIEGEGDDKIKIIVRVEDGLVVGVDNPMPDTIDVEVRDYDAHDEENIEGEDECGEYTLSVY